MLGPWLQTAREIHVGVLFIFNEAAFQLLAVSVFQTDGTWSYRQTSIISRSFVGNELADH